MKQQYPVMPEAVKVYSVGNETDIILRKDIEAVEKTDEGMGDRTGSSASYTVYECEEKQIRYAGTITKEEVEAAFDSWWDYEVPVTEPEATAEERLVAIQSAQEAQDEVLAEILLNTLTV